MMLKAIAEVRCPNCRKLVAYDVVAARFKCARCKLGFSVDVRASDTSGSYGETHFTVKADIDKAESSV